VERERERERERGRERETEGEGESLYTSCLAVLQRVHVKVLQRELEKGARERERVGGGERERERESIYTSCLAVLQRVHVKVMQCELKKGSSGKVPACIKVRQGNDRQPWPEEGMNWRGSLFEHEIHQHHIH
jgi:hypothetical protein